MNRYTIRGLTIVAVLVLAVGAVWSQGWGMGRGRLANASPEDQQKIIDLHQKVREAQWKLWQLQSQDADKKEIEKQTKAVNGLRDQLSRLKTNLPPGPCYQFNPDASPPAAGQAAWQGRGGYGPRGMGFGRGGGRGMGRGGRGMGRGMGMGWNCPWRTQTPATTQTQPTQ